MRFDLRHLFLAGLCACLAGACKTQPSPSKPEEMVALRQYAYQPIDFRLASVADLPQKAFLVHYFTENENAQADNLVFSFGQIDLPTFRRLNKVYFDEEMVGYDAER